MRSLMNSIRTKYGNPPVIITENGMDDPNDALIPLKDALKDEKRIKYHNNYLTNLLASIKEDGCNVKEYWTNGSGKLATPQGLAYFVDYKDKLKKCPKDSLSIGSTSS